MFRINVAYENKVRTVCPVYINLKPKCFRLPTGIYRSNATYVPAVVCLEFLTTSCLVA